MTIQDNMIQRHNGKARTSVVIKDPAKFEALRAWLVERDWPVGEGGPGQMLIYGKLKPIDRALAQAFTELGL